jgi:hypothetical protein
MHAAMALFLPHGGSLFRDKKQRFVCLAATSPGGQGRVVLLVWGKGPGWHEMLEVFPPWFGGWI